MFAGLVVEVEGPLGLDSWAAIFVCPFVVFAAMVCSSMTIDPYRPGVWEYKLGRGIWYLSGWLAATRNDFVADLGSGGTKVIYT